MHLADIDLKPNKLINLQAESWEVVESVNQHFLQQQGFELASVAGRSNSGRQDIDSTQTVASWLANDANISNKEAIETINAFPIPVALYLNQIAMNPCRFLGLASSIARSPSAIVFSTAGMDPVGFKSLHEYATKQYAGALLHLDVMPCKYCRTNGQAFSVSADLGVNAV